MSSSWCAESGIFREGDPRAADSLDFKPSCEGSLDSPVWSAQGSGKHSLGPTESVWPENLLEMQISPESEIPGWAQQSVPAGCSEAAELLT